jgi:hypothetical protein
MAVAVNLLLLPASAVLAGLLVWVLYRNERLEDGALLRHFVLILFVAVALTWKISRTEAVQMRLYPQLRVAAEVDAYPLYATLHRLAPDDGKRLLVAAAGQIGSGATVPEAFHRQRAILMTLATERLGFADQGAKIAWGRVAADTLRRLQAGDADLCYRVLSRQEVDAASLAQAFTVAEARDFEQAVIALYESADRGMRREWPATDQPADFNEAARQFQMIKEELERKFGAEVAATIARKDMPVSPPAAPGQLCAARIYQLEAMMRRPKATAAMLVDSALR